VSVRGECSECIVTFYTGGGTGEKTTLRSGSLDEYAVINWNTMYLHNQRENDKLLPKDSPSQIL